MYKQFMRNKHPALKKRKVAVKEVSRKSSGKVRRSFSLFHLCDWWDDFSPPPLSLPPSFPPFSLPPSLLSPSLPPSSPLSLPPSLPPLSSFLSSPPLPLPSLPPDCKKRSGSCEDASVLSTAVHSWIQHPHIFRPVPPTQPRSVFSSGYIKLYCY